MLKKWEELPCDMQNPQVRRYYDILSRKKWSLCVKRIADVLISALLLVLLCPVLLLIGIAVRLDSKGPGIFRQVRITAYGRPFYIYKFRSMVKEADRRGGQLTVKGDARITRVGRFLRKWRLDELLQLLNVLAGDMTLVGVRPEVERYVRCYTDEMKATLLLPAGITSRASIRYKDEEKLLEREKDADWVYLNRILPDKMKYNLEELEHFSLWQDVRTMLETLLAVIK